MTKEELANEITKAANIMRTISTDHKLNLKAGSIYDNHGAVESWSDADNPFATFEPESERSFDYTFLCNSVPVHEVDYDNDDEAEILDAEGCENEGEVLVPADVKMRIVSVATDEDAAEMGYYEVQLEVLK